MVRLRAPAPVSGADLRARGPGCRVARRGGRAAPSRAATCPSRRRCTTSRWRRAPVPRGRRGCGRCKRSACRRRRPPGAPCRTRRSWRQPRAGVPTAGRSRSSVSPSGRCRGVNLRFRRCLSTHLSSRPVPAEAGCRGEPAPALCSGSGCRDPAMRLLSQVPLALSPCNDDNHTIVIPNVVLAAGCRRWAGPHR